MIDYTVGTYKIIEKIGEGGMGAVYRGIDIMLEREVAIKALRPELARQPDLVERFRSEAKTLAKLNHPNIATVFNFLRQNDDFFMVMEFVRGETLDNTIRRFGAMPVDRAVPLFCQALEGLDHAHGMGIIHRDIKPANMMLSETGTIKVMDFGIARVLGSARMTKQGNIVGTIEYMSPEQVRGQETDARSDIYSMGILLYEMLTGRVPFSSDSEYDLMKMQIEVAPTPPRVFAGQIPEAIERAIMRALAKQSEARFQTAGELRAILLGNAGFDADQSAPVAQPNRGIVTPSITEAAVKETRIGGGAGVLPSEGGGQFQAIPPAFAAAESVYAPSSSPQYVQPQHSLSKLNWKHYSAAAAVLAVLIAVPVVLVSGGSGKKEVAPQPGVSQPRSSPPVESSRPAPPTPPPGGQGAAITPAPSEAPPLTVPGTNKPAAAGELSPLQLPRASDTGDASKQAKSTAKNKDDAAARAKAEKERKAAEARRLLNQ